MDSGRATSDPTTVLPLAGFALKWVPFAVATSFWRFMTAISRSLPMIDVLAAFNRRMAGSFSRSRHDVVVGDWGKKRLEEYRTSLTITLAIPVSQWDSVGAFFRLDLSLAVCGMPPLTASKNVFTSARSSLAKDNKRMSLLLICP